MPLESKGIYHSNLVAAGPTTFAITGAIKKSQKGSRVPIRLLSGEEKTLFIENDAVEAAINAAPRNVWLEAVASGRREAAKLGLRILEGDNAPPPPPRKLSDVERMKRAAMLAIEICDSLPRPLTEIEWNMAATLFINGEGEEVPAETTPAPRPGPRTPTEEEAMESFIHRPLDGGKHKGKSWLDIVAIEPDYVEWAVRGMKSLTDAQRDMLRKLLDEFSQLSPFEQETARQDAELLF